MKIFDYEIEDAVLGSAFTDAEAEYPSESCGIVLGDETRRHGTQFVRLCNHAGPKSGQAFRVNEIEYMKVLLKGRELGLRPLAFFTRIRMRVRLYRNETWRII